MDQVLILNLADRSTCESLWSDVSDTCARANSREPGIGDDSNMFAIFKVFQCASQLVGLFHTGPHRTTTNQYDDIASLERTRVLPLGCCYGFLFGREYAGRSSLAIDAIVIDDRRINCGRFDDRTIRADVSLRETNGAGQSHGSGFCRWNDDIIRMHAVSFVQHFSQRNAAIRLFPCIEDFMPSGA